jgi:hypothetical protein
MDTNTEYNEFLSAQNVRFIKSQFTLHITMHQPMLADQYRLKLKSIVHSLVSISNIISEVLSKQFFIELELTVLGVIYWLCCTNLFMTAYSAI